MKSLAVAIPLFVLAGMFLPEGAAAQPVAGMIVSVDGPVAVHRGQGALPVTRGFSLEPGDSLVVKQGGRCAGFSPAGEAFDRNGPALIVFARPGDDNFRSRMTKWVAQQLAQWVGSSRSRPLIARSAGEDWLDPAEGAIAVAPGSDGSVRPENPLLMWKPSAGVDAYTVTIAGEDGGETTQVVNGNQFRATELLPGLRYAWKVSFSAGDHEFSSDWREFRVLTADEERVLDASLDGLSELMAGIVLLSAGLNQEAIALFDKALTGAEAKDAAFWRARAFAGMGLYAQAYQSVVESMERE